MTQSEIFENYVNEIKHHLMLAKSSIFDSASSDWPDDAIAGFFKARLELEGDPIYRDCVRRLAKAFASNPDKEERFDLYAKRAYRVLKTEVTNIVRSACKDMAEIKNMLGLKPERKYRHSEVLVAGTHCVHITNPNGCRVTQSVKDGVLTINISSESE